MEISSYLPKDLYKGKTVFITGGGSGINLGIAKNFAVLGANVAICGRTQSRLDEAATQLTALGAKVCAVAADVREMTAMERALARTHEELGPVDVLVCGAAGNFMCRAEDMSSNGFKTVIDIDLNGTFIACRAAFKQLKSTHGAIVFVSAPQAYTPTAFQLHAAAAKAGIEITMRNLALEWGRYGIRCNSVVPGLIDGTEGVRKTQTIDSIEHQQKSTPLRRLGSVDDIGHAVVFLASPLASFVTGTRFIVDGGLSLTGRILLDASYEGAFPAANARK